MRSPADPRRAHERVHRRHVAPLHKLGEGVECREAEVLLLERLAELIDERTADALRCDAHRTREGDTGFDDDHEHRQQDDDDRAERNDELLFVMVVVPQEAGEVFEPADALRRSAPGHDDDDQGNERREDGGDDDQEPIELLNAVVAHAVPPSRLTGRQPARASSARAVGGVRSECGTSAVRAAAGGGSKPVRNADMIPSIRAD